MSETPSKLRPKYSRRRRVIAVVLFLTVVVIVGSVLAFAQTDYGEGRLLAYVIPKIEDALKCDLTFSDMQLKVMSFRPRAVLRDVTCDWRDPEAPESAKSSMVVVEFAPIQTFAARTDIRRIIIHDLFIEVNVVDDKLVGLDLVGSGDGSEGAYTVAIDELLVKGGTLHVGIDDPDVSFTLEEIQATVTPDLDWNSRIELTSRGRKLRYADFEEVLGAFETHLYVNVDPLSVEIDKADVTLGTAMSHLEGTMGPGPGFDLDLKGTLPLSYIKRIEPETDDLVGVARYDGNLVVKEEGEFKWRGLVRVPGLKVDGYYIGDVAMQMDMDPRRVEVTDIVGENVGGGRVTGHGTVALTDNAYTRADLKLHNVKFEDILENSHVSGSHVTALFNGSLLLEGPAKPMVLAAELNVDVRRFQVRDRPYNVANPELTLSLPPSHLDARAIWRKDGFEILGAVGRVGRDTVVTYRGELIFPESNRAGRLEFDYELGHGNLDEIGRLGGLKMLGLARAKGTIVGSTEDPLIASDVAIEGFDLEGVDFGDARGTLTMSGQILSSPDTVIVHGRTPYRGDWKLDFNDPEVPITFNVLSDEGRLEELLDISEPFKSMVPNINGDVRRVQASLSGPIRALTGTFEARVENVTAWGESFRSVSVTRGQYKDGRMEFGNIFAQKKAGRVYGRGSLEVNNDLQFEVRTEAFTLAEIDRLGKDFPFKSKASGRLTLGGTLDALSIDGWIGLQGTTMMDMRSLEPSKVQIKTTGRTMTLDYNLAGGEVGGKATVDLDDPKLAYDGEFYVLQHPLDPYLTFYNPAVRDASGRISGTLKTNGTLAELAKSNWYMTISDLFIARGIRNVKTARMFDLTIEDGAVRIDDRKSLKLVGPVDPKTGQLVPKPITDFEVAGTSRDNEGRLDFGARGTLDLAFVDLFADVFSRIEGQLRLIPSRISPPPGGKDAWVATLTGTVDDPRLDVWGRVENGAIKSKYFPLGVEDLHGNLRITTDRVFLGLDRRGRVSCDRGSAIQAKAGGGELRGCGTLALDGFSVNNWDVQGQLTRPTMMRFSDPQMRAVVSSPKGEMLRMRGVPGENLVLSGNLDLNELRYTESFDWKAKAVTLREIRLLQVVPDEEAQLFDLDLVLRAPDGKIYVKNQDANIEMKGEVRVVGNVAQWGLIGSLSMVHGTARFQDTEFTLTKGRVEFDNPKIVDFELDLAGEAVIQDYSVFLSVTGRFLDEFHFDTQSQPPLSKEQVHVLLVLKVPPGELSDREFAAAGALISSVAGEGYASKGGVLDVLKGGLPLDSVEVIPTYADDGEVGVSIVGRKLLGKEKNTEMTISLKPPLGNNTETETSWQLEHKATRRLRFTFGCDHGDRNTTGGSDPADTPGGLQTIRGIGDCTADAKFRWEFR